MYQRLQKVGLCLSHCCTVKVVEHLGDHFDWKVKEWQGVAEGKLSTSQVIINNSKLKVLKAVNLMTKIFCSF